MAELATWPRNVANSPRSTTTAPVTPSTQPMETDLEPCASTASLFLFSQGPVIVCLHHDSLAVERRFMRHQERITFISVDNVSERGAGRLVVSYDASQTAIVWDLFTGQEISRFASFEPLRVASWMRNGNVAFGNGKGEVILFEPSTSEHISARTIFDPITSLAPASDCRTYAIGYQNGSILIASLQPSFTILHTLTTSRGPSPIVALAWHASSSKQKSDMLATQTLDGDLRVWSVAKLPSSESPRVIRALKRSEPYSNGPKWIGWSKNGRIVQYSDRETWIWDVRTKHVTYETIPTIEDVLGMANYGPTATLFTLGPNHTVQQYDLENPAIVANVQLPPVDAMPPPAVAGRLRSPSPGSLVRKDTPQVDSAIVDVDSLRRTTQDLTVIDAARQQRAETASSLSGRSQSNSISSKASSGRIRPFSPPLKSTYSGTTFSVTSPLGRAASQATGTTSIAYGSAASVSSNGRSRGGSRLRNEVIPSPAEKPLEDLFPYTRARVNDVQYNRALVQDDNMLTSDQLRRQMLSVVFGWDDDIEALIRDELNRHAPGSQNAIFLSRWLGEQSTDQMFAMIGTGNVSATAWMFLALSQMGGQEQANQVGQTFVQRLLEVGDIHASATILLALGDRNDAIEVYVSRNYFMEAILMTCLLMPSDWQRQSYLVRRWGEHVVSNAHQQLAIRCFMCTGAEPSEPWTSPTAPNAPGPFGELNAGPSSIESPATSSKPPITIDPSKPEANSRMTVKNSSLKLITSFGPAHSQHFKFPGLKSDDRTPTNAPGVTPIAESAVGESALSPGGLGSYRLNNIRSINLAMSARPGPPGNYVRRRLPSIGETPVDVQPPTILAPQSLPTPVDSGSDKEKLAEQTEKKRLSTLSSQNKPKNNAADPLVLLTSARYEPTKDSHDPSPQTAVQTTTVKGLPSPSAAIFDNLTDHRRSRNGSRDRKPEGLHIQWPPPDRPGSGSLSNPMGFSTYTPSAEQSDATVDSQSATSFAQSLRSGKSPALSGRSIDQYISSLEEAHYYSKQERRQHGRGRDKREPETKAKQPSRTGSIDSRGRSNNRYIQPAKRSPSSPVPMSPEDFVRHNASVESVQSNLDSEKPRNRSRHGKASSRNRHVSTTERRQRSSSRGTEKKQKASSRHRSRGRSGDRDISNISTIRSPTSPIPMSPSGEDQQSNSRAFEESLRLVTVDRERLRSRNRDRSTSRRPGERGTSARRDPSPDRRRTRARSRSRQALEREAQTNGESTAPMITTGESDAFSAREMLSDASYKSPVSLTNAAPLTMAERLKREQAAAELEARRLSLARRPSAPVIPLPGEGPVGKPQPEQVESPPSSGGSFSQRYGRANQLGKGDYPGGDHGSQRGRSGNSVGLPATPRAMRHPKYSDGQVEDVPAVPDLPGSVMTLPSTSYQSEAGRIGRSMSVPIVEFQTEVPRDLPHHPRFNPALPRSRSNSRNRTNGHGRKGSRDIGSNSGASAYGGSPPLGYTSEGAPMDVVISEVSVPAILPELQHLSSPPPPPPPPAPAPGMMVPRDAGPIVVGAENAHIGKDMPRPYTTGPTGGGEPHPTQYREGHRMSVDHRRGRSINESFANKLRNFTGRMRSTSRGAAVRSPPTEPNEKVSPYESILPVDNRL